MPTTPPGTAKALISVVDDHQLYPPVLQFALSDQLVDQVLEVIEEQGVVYRGNLAAKNP